MRRRGAGVCDQCLGRRQFRHFALLTERDTVVRRLRERGLGHVLQVIGGTGLNTAPPSSASGTSTGVRLGFHPRAGPPRGLLHGQGQFSRLAARSRDDTADPAGLQPDAGQDPTGSGSDTCAQRRGRVHQPRRLPGGLRRRRDSGAGSGDGGAAATGVVRRVHRAHRGSGQVAQLGPGQPGRQGDPTRGRAVHGQAGRRPHHHHPLGARQSDHPPAGGGQPDSSSCSQHRWVRAGSEGAAAFEPGGRAATGKRCGGTQRRPGRQHVPGSAGRPGHLCRQADGAGDAAVPGGQRRRSVG